MRAPTLVRIAGFLLLITAPLIGMAWNRGALTSEKRARAPRPALSLKTWRGFPEKFDAYFRDSFGLREQLIRWHHVLAIKHLRESPVKQVIVGGSNRLFYAGYDDGLDINDFAGRHLIPPAELDAYVTHALARRKQYEGIGARYLVVLVPNKQTVYPEDVPARFGPHAPGVFDAVMAKLAQRTDVEVLDLRPVLRAHRDEPVFYDTDTHWNANGAFWAASAIVDRVRPWFPSVQPLRREDYEIVRSRHAGLDLAGMLAMGDDFEDDQFIYRRRGAGAQVVTADDIVHQIWQRPGTKLPRVLLLGDSFGLSLGPALADAFGRVHYYYVARAGYDPRLIETEKPDLVILQVVERYLPNLASH